MIPQLVVPVEALPTLPNGKIDQRRLAQLATQVGGGATPVAAPPRAGDEAVLHQIWSELLGIPRIDRDQDFFELGGHSLLAMQVVTRVREELQKNCTLAQVFRHPTLASLCAALGDSAALTSHTLVPLQEEGEGRPLFCLCGIQLYRPLVRELALDNPVFAAYVPVSGPTGVEALAAEYLAVIRSQQPRGPYRLLGFSLGGVLAFEIARQLLAEGEKVEQLVILDSDVPGGESASGMKGVLRGVRRALTGGDPEARAMPDYLRAIREYRPQRYPGRAVYVEATRADHFEPGYGWPDLVQGLVTLHVDSDHLEMMSRAKAAELARVLRPVLARDPAAASSA
jgi:thioesterase domain-containing protein